MSVYKLSGSLTQAQAVPPTILACCIYISFLSACSSLSLCQTTYNLVYEQTCKHKIFDLFVVQKSCSVEPAYFQYFVHVVFFFGLSVDT